MNPNFYSRRELLRQVGMGMGTLGLGALLGRDALGATGKVTGLNDRLNPLSPLQPEYRARAKRVIHIFANGGPSQVDTFDYKPMLAKYDGKELPGDGLKTERKTGAAMRSPFEFRQYGESGQWISDLFPHVAESADDLCIINSMHANVPNHEPSLMLMNC
ncbi:MAG: DUF1501 domain-containing protein, partial [Verrucomicrobiae bacterium]|nr:DUF1501 domain-containing protein [Verrucomicrobiae bacterium]